MKKNKKKNMKWIWIFIIFKIFKTLKENQLIEDQYIKKKRINNEGDPSYQKNEDNNSYNLRKINI